MFDPDELPPSASRRSFLTGAGAVAGAAAFGQVTATTDDEQRPTRLTDSTSTAPMNLVTDVDQHDDFPETVTAVSVAQMNSRKK
jgi:hypothetical protein